MDEETKTLETSQTEETEVVSKAEADLADELIALDDALKAHGLSIVTILRVAAKNAFGVSV